MDKLIWKVTQSSVTGYLEVEVETDGYRDEALTALLDFLEPYKRYISNCTHENIDQLGEVLTSAVLIAPEPYFKQIYDDLLKVEGMVGSMSS